MALATPRPLAGFRRTAKCPYDYFGYQGFSSDRDHRTPVGWGAPVQQPTTSLPPCFSPMTPNPSLFNEKSPQRGRGWKCQRPKAPMISCSGRDFCEAEWHCIPVRRGTPAQQHNPCQVMHPPEIKDPLPNDPLGDPVFGPKNTLPPLYGGKIWLIKWPPSKAPIS